MSSLIEESMKHMSTKSPLTEETFVVVHPATGKHSEFKKELDAKMEIDKILGPAGRIMYPTGIAGASTSSEVNIVSMTKLYKKLKSGVRHAQQISSANGTKRLVTYKK